MILSVFVVRSIQATYTMSRSALLLISAMASLSIVTATLRYAFIYALEVDTLDAALDPWISFWTRLEVLFMNAAYGLVTVRWTLRYVGHAASVIAERLRSSSIISSGGGGSGGGRGGRRMGGQGERIRVESRDETEFPMREGAVSSEVRVDKGWSAYEV